MAADAATKTGMTTAEKIGTGAAVAGVAAPLAKSEPKKNAPVRQDVETGITPPGRKRRRTAASTVRGGKRNSLGG